MSPRPPGSPLDSRDDGLLVGSVSGGCIEDDLVATARDGALATDLPKGLCHAIDADTAQRFGLPCGGPIKPVSVPVPARTQLCAWLGPVGTRRAAAVGADHRHRDCATAACHPEAADERRAAAHRHHADPHHGVRCWLLIGVGQMTQYLALTEAVTSPALAIGAIGSRLNQARRQARPTAHLGITGLLLTRIYGPVGLKNGARPPPEIAHQHVGRAPLLREQLRPAVIDIEPGAAPFALDPQDPQPFFCSRATLTEIADELRDLRVPILDDLKQLSGTLRVWQGGIASVLANATTASSELARAATALQLLMAGTGSTLTGIGNQPQGLLTQGTAAVSRVSGLVEQVNTRLEVVNGASPGLLNKADRMRDKLQGVATDLLQISSAAATTLSGVLLAAPPRADDAQELVQGARRSWLLRGLLPPPLSAKLPIRSHDAAVLCNAPAGPLGRAGRGPGRAEPRAGGRGAVLNLTRVNARLGDLAGADAAADRSLAAPSRFGPAL